MASPVAASCAGLLKSFNMDWDNEKIETMILATADPVIYSVNPESFLEGKLGRGKIDMLKAISTPLFPKLELAGEDITIINDNDGQINIGESLEYRVIILNDPEWGEAINPILTLSTESNGINFINNNASLANISPGDASINDVNPIIIEFTDSAPTGDVTFKANILSNQDGYINYSASIPFTLNVSEFEIIYGDVTNDGVIDILDAVSIVNIVMGSLEPSSYQLIASDINQDNSINVQDVILAVNLILSN